MGEGVTSILIQRKEWDFFTLYGLCFLCPQDDWWSSGLSWLDISYLNMGVKLVIEKTRALHEALILKLEYICGLNALGGDR